MWKKSLVGENSLSVEDNEGVQIKGNLGRGLYNLKPGRLETAFWRIKRLKPLI